MNRALIRFSMFSVLLGFWLVVARRNPRRGECAKPLSMACIPVVTALGPVVGRAAVSEADRSDAFDVLDAVLDRDGQSQRRAVWSCQGFAIHLVTEQRLRMQRALHIQSDVITAVFCSVKSMEFSLLAAASST